MAPHSSTLAWKIPWVEEPGGLQSMGSLESDTTERLHFHFSLSCIGEGNGNPLQCSCLENPRDRGAWWAAIYGMAQSRTWLKRLSSSSSIINISWNINFCYLNRVPIYTLFCFLPLFFLLLYYCPVYYFISKDVGCNTVINFLNLIRVYKKHWPSWFLFIFQISVHKLLFRESLLISQARLSLC